MSHVSKTKFNIDIDPLTLFARLQILAIICTHTHTDKSLITCTVRTILCFRDDLHKHMLAHAGLREPAQGGM